MVGSNYSFLQISGDRDRLLVSRFVEHLAINPPSTMVQTVAVKLLAAFENVPQNVPFDFLFILRCVLADFRSFFYLISESFVRVDRSDGFLLVFLRP